MLIFFGLVLIAVKEGEYSLMGSVGPVKTKPWARVRVLRSVMRSG